MIYTTRQLRCIKGDKIVGYLRLENPIKVLLDGATNWVDYTPERLPFDYTETMLGVWDKEFKAFRSNIEMTGTHYGDSILFYAGDVVTQDGIPYFLTNDFTELSFDGWTLLPIDRHGSYDYLHLSNSLIKLGTVHDAQYRNEYMVKKYYFEEEVVE